MSSSSYDSATAVEDGTTQHQFRRGSTKRGSFRKLKHLITGGSKKDKRKSAGAVPPTANSSPSQNKMMISEPIPVKVKRHNVDETRDISLKQGDKPVSVVKPINSEGPTSSDPVLEKYSSLRQDHHHRSVTPESNATMSTALKKEMSRSCNSLARSSLKQASPDRDGIPVTKMSISKRPGSRESSVTRRSPLDEVTSPTGPRSTSFSGEYGRQQQQKKLHGNTSKENVSSSEHVNKSATAAVTYRSNDSSKQVASNKHSSVASSESGLSVGSVGLDSEQDDYAILLEAQPWYHGRMNATVSEMLVHKEGDFLVWETQSKPTSFILTVYWDGRPQHVQINVFEVASNEGSGGKKCSFKYHFDNGAFDSIAELVHNHLKYQIPVSKFFDGIIATPVSRANCGVKELSMEHQPIHRSYTVSSSHAHGVSKKKYSGSSQTLQRNSTDPAGVYAGCMPLSHHIPELSEERDYGFWPGYRAPSESALHQVGSDDVTAYHRIGPDYHRAGMSRMKHGPLYESIYVSERMGGYPLSSQPRKYYNLLPAQPGSSSVAYSTTSLRRPKKKRQDTEAKMSSAYNSSQDAHAMHYWPSGMSEADERRVSMFGTMRKNKERAASRVENNTASVSNLSISSNLTDSDTVIGDQDSIRGSSSDIFTNQKRDTIVHCLPTPKQSRAASIDSDYVYMEGIKPTPFALAFFDKSDKPEDEGEAKESPLLNTVKKQSTPHPFASSTNISIASSDKRSPSPAAGKPSSTSMKCQSELNRVEQMFVAYHVEELAQHLTLADAVLMQLIPRPRESEGAYWERLKREGACGGHCVGLEVMGLPEGEKLWNKLMNRHHSLSQWVQACVVCSDDIEQRAKVIAKFVELARALQSSCFGNVFAFFAIMSGLATSQVSGLSQTWLEFHSSYSELSDTFNNQLQHTFSALRAGAKVFALEYVSVPSVQCLGDTYFPNFSLADGLVNNHDSEGLMEDFSNFATSLENYRNLLFHCASFSYNSRKRLSNYKYDQKLFEYFLQDHPRQILHRMELGVNLEDPAERKRRFDVILQALIERPTN